MAKRALEFVRASRARVEEARRKHIAGTVIVGRFCNCLGLPLGFDMSTKLEDILGGGLEKWDLGLELMGYMLFMQDGLILQKADVVHAKTVADLGQLVFDWYRADGWTVE